MTTDKTMGPLTLKHRLSSEGIDVCKPSMLNGVHLLCERPATLIKDMEAQNAPGHVTAMMQSFADFSLTPVAGDKISANPSYVPSDKLWFVG